MVYIGIDPGQSGAIALISNKFIKVYDWVDGPSMAGVLMVWSMFYDIKLAALEQVGAMPKQGVSSMFKFGANFGWWQGALDALKLPYVLVRPQTWQKGLVPKKKDKADKPSLLVARRMFPQVDLSLKKHDGRADALLIADWTKRRYEGLV
jgi:crossover junction endodeoxyribonuclease RuvC